MDVLRYKRNKKVDGIVLSGLTIRDAEALAVVCWTVIGGFPGGPRGSFDRIRAALITVGIDGQNLMEKYSVKYSGAGNIVYIDKAAK